MKSGENEKCGKCGVENGEWKMGVRKMKSVENGECGK